MYSFFEFFAKRHLLAYLITVMTILLGAVSLLTIRRDIFPQVEYGLVVITTRYSGASPEDVELNVTNKIEDELNLDITPWVGGTGHGVSGCVYPGQNHRPDDVSLGGRAHDRLDQETGC